MSFILETRHRRRWGQARERFPQYLGRSARRAIGHVFIGVALSSWARQIQLQITWIKASLRDVITSEPTSGPRGWCRLAEHSGLFPALRGPVKVRACLLGVCVSVEGQSRGGES